MSQAIPTKTEVLALAQSRFQPLDDLPESLRPVVNSTREKLAEKLLELRKHSLGLRVNDNDAIPFLSDLKAAYTLALTQNENIKDQQRTKDTPPRTTDEAIAEQAFLRTQADYAVVYGVIGRIQRDISSAASSKG